MEPRRITEARGRGRRFALSTLGALGIVYGDIGTSPLYALREAVAPGSGLAVDEATVLGLLSLIWWSMTIVVTLKYVLVVMQAHDHGEGGILALVTVATSESRRPHRVVLGLTAIGLFGTALLYGDGMITPAISVLSAVEGLGVLTPTLEPYVVPVAVSILIALFAIQRHGTARIGALFGPVMLAWFGFLGLTGVIQLAHNPAVLRALSPTYGIAFLADGGLPAFLSLGAVFLVVTGAEALYADMGHFGHRPIAIGWGVLVLPALTLQYLGQGALLLRSPEVADAVFYRMVPGWLLAPAVGLATLATVIASQALISGAFSLTAQAVQLGYVPRLEVDHTSEREIGQVYVPVVNGLLLVATIGLVIGFQSSARLADAYGVAVVLTMAITTALFYVVARDQLGWHPVLARAAGAVFAVVDLAFLGANLPKVPSGGWFPIVAGGTVFTVMSTWKRGRQLLARRMRAGELPISRFLTSVGRDRPTRVPGTAVYLYGKPFHVPPALLANLRRNHVLHEDVAIVAVVVARQAHLPRARREEVTDLGHGFTQIVLRYGFADDIDVPRDLGLIIDPDFGFNPDDATYVLGSEIVLPTPGSGMALWRERFFALMHRNAGRASRHFRLPPDRVVEVGQQVEI